MGLWLCAADLLQAALMPWCRETQQETMGWELWPDSASAANIGIMLFRKSAGKLAKVGLALIFPDMDAY